MGFAKIIRPPAPDVSCARVHARDSSGQTWDDTATSDGLRRSKAGFPRSIRMSVVGPVPCVNKGQGDTRGHNGCITMELMTQAGVGLRPLQRTFIHDSWA